MAYPAAVGHRSHADGIGPHLFPARRPGAEPDGGHPVARRRSAEIARCVRQSAGGVARRPAGVPGVIVMRSFIALGLVLAAGPALAAPAIPFHDMIAGAI